MVHCDYNTPELTRAAGFSGGTVVEPWIAPAPR
jgi:hypothetical protein